MSIEETPAISKDLSNKSIIFSCAIKLVKDNLVELCLLSTLIHYDNFRNAGVMYALKMIDKKLI